LKNSKQLYFNGLADLRATRSNSFAKISSQIPLLIENSLKRKKVNNNLAIYFTKWIEHAWLAFYNHRKSRDIQLLILQSRIAHLLEPMFCYTDSNIASTVRVAKVAYSCWMPKNTQIPTVKKPCVLGEANT
jgi:hypothetical protein